MCFGCSKEPSHWDGSFEYPQHMFWLRNKISFSYAVLSGGLSMTYRMTYRNEQQMKGHGISTIPQKRYLLWHEEHLTLCMLANFSCSDKYCKGTPIWQRFIPVKFDEILLVLELGTHSCMNWLKHVSFDNKSSGLQMSVYPKIIFLISKPKHMLWVLKRAVLMKRFFCAPKTYV